MTFVRSDIMRNTGMCGVIAGLCIVVSGCGSQEAPPPGEQWQQQEETQPAQPGVQESTPAPQGEEGQTSEGEGQTWPTTPTE